MKRALVVVALSLVFLSSVQAAPSIVLNGSFEEDQGIPVGTFAAQGAGDPDILGWTIGGTGVDWVGTYWTPSDGLRSLDLNSTGAGSILQILPTIAGEWYQVTFDMAANPDGGSSPKSLMVIADGQNMTFSSAANPKNGQWDAKSWAFQADGNTELVFTSLMMNDNGYGPALDNVTVALIRDTAVPAPGALLLGSLGAAMVGFVRRRALRS